MRRGRKNPEGILGAFVFKIDSTTLEPGTKDVFFTMLQGLRGCSVGGIPSHQHREKSHGGLVAILTETRL